MGGLPDLTAGGTNVENDKRGSCVLAYRRRRRGVGYMAICRDCLELAQSVCPVLTQREPLVRFES